MQLCLTTYKYTYVCHTAIKCSLLYCSADFIMAMLSIWFQLSTICNVFWDIITMKCSLSVTVRSLESRATLEGFNMLVILEEYTSLTHFLLNIWISFFTFHLNHTAAVSMYPAHWFLCRKWCMEQIHTFTSIWIYFLANVSSILTFQSSILSQTSAFKRSNVHCL